MIVFVNGNFVAEEQAAISVFDRGLMYGDGCFETIRVDQEKPAFWTEHLNRLAGSLDALQIPFEVNSDQLARVANHLITTNQLAEAVLRIQVTRGRGERGYSIKGAVHPSIIVSLHPMPQNSGLSTRSWKLRTSSIVWDTTSPIAPHKSSNKLIQILGKIEAEGHDVDDVLFLTQDGSVTETSTANLFWLDGHTLVTPPLNTGILPGIARQITLELGKTQGYAVREKRGGLAEIKQSELLFLTQSVHGIIPISEIDVTRFEPHPLTTILQAAFREKSKESYFPELTPRDLGS